MTDNSILMALAEADRLRYQQQQDETFKRWAAEKSKQMDVNPVDSQKPPPGWHEPEDRIIQMAIKIGGGKKYGFPVGFEPGMPVNEAAQPDIARELSPEGKRARWDEAIRRQNGE